MARKPRSTSAPAAPPAPAPTEKPRQPRRHVPAKVRALEALKTARLALMGLPAADSVAFLERAVQQDVPDNHEPKREGVGPLQPGEWCDFKPAYVHLARHRSLTPPLRVVLIREEGRSTQAVVECPDEDENGQPIRVRDSLPVSYLRRCDPPEPETEDDDAPIPYRLAEEPELDAGAADLLGDPNDEVQS